MIKNPAFKWQEKIPHTLLKLCYQVVHQRLTLLLVCLSEILLLLGRVSVMPVDLDLSTDMNLVSQLRLILLRLETFLAVPQKIIHLPARRRLSLVDIV